MLRVIVVANFTKFFAVVVMIWVDRFYIQFLLFLCYPVLFQALRGSWGLNQLVDMPFQCDIDFLVSVAMLSLDWLKALMIVAGQSCVLLIASIVLSHYRIYAFHAIAESMFPQ